MKKHFMVVVYDISNDKRRTRLHKKLLNFGSPVQYSVFECLLSAEEIDAMKKVVDKVIRKTIDHVRYYPLCADCYRKIATTAHKPVTSEKGVYIV